MKTIIYATNEFLCPDLALRLKNEGYEVLIAQKSTATKKILKGTLKRIPYETRFDYKDAFLFIADDNENDDASRARAMGISAIGGDKKTVKLELDRSMANEVAELCGLETPELVEVADLEEARLVIKERGGKWVLKQMGKLDSVKGLNHVAKMDNSEDLLAYIDFLQERWVEGLEQEFVLQEKMEGHEMATGSYWNGKEFMKDADGDEICEENFEHKALFAGNMGESTGEQYTVMRYVKAKYSKLFMATLDKIRPLLQSMDFRGDVDINCVINEKGAWFLEFTPRMGVPATSAQIAIHKSNWGEFLKAMADGVQIPFEYDGRYCIVSWLYTKPFPFVNSQRMTEFYEEGFGETKGNIDRINELLSFKLSNSEGLQVLFKKELTKEDLHHLHWDAVVFDGQGLRVATPDGYILTATGMGETVDKAGESVVKLLSKIVVPKSFYRNDFSNSNYHKAEKDLLAWGYLKSYEDSIKQTEEDNTAKRREAKRKRVRKTLKSAIL